MRDAREHTPLGLPDVIARLPAADDEWTPVLSLGPCPPGGVTFAAMTGDALAAMLAGRAATVAGADAKFTAADLIGALGWSLCQSLAGLTMAGLQLGTVPPGAVALVLRRVDWESDGTTGTGHVFDVTLDPSGITVLPADTADLTARLALLAAIEALFAPLIAEIQTRTWLGQAALWRLVGDCLTYAFLDRGRALGRADQGMEIGRFLVGQRGTRLFSRQTGYVLVTAPENPAPDRPCTAEWFRLRGGCCRYYTLDGHGYCSTCVLRDDDSRISRLRDHLRDRMIAAV